MEATWRWVLVTAIAPVCWGATYYVTREFLPPGYPLYGGVLRALPAGLVLLAVVRARPRGAWWWRSAVLGALNMSGFFVLVYVAAQLLPTSVASVVMATGSVVLMLIAWAVLRERPRLLSLAGAVAGIAGVACMLLSGGERVEGWGVLASVGAMLMSSVGYVLAKKWNDDAPVLATTAWQLLAGGLILLPFAVAFEGNPPEPTPGRILGFAFVSLIATAISFAAWFGGLKRLPAGSVGLIGLLNPVTGLALGTLIAGEALAAQQVAGVGLVFAGILMGQVARGARRRGAGAPGTAGGSRRRGARVPGPVPREDAGNPEMVDVSRETSARVR
ncbi:DMT family transporter [Rothia sp. AR01]|uniref:DMT family transporter n=1 Tax=Rothia santali TaxID=2949643 RepID=A0A9X2KGY4_9MICC|nr:EamA family transporter [Rothia santali]MCP3424628.1 DMT family transporter [Rothia santali]